MEKVNKMSTIVKIGGDCDEHVDWEDFVLIQDQITTSFNERKLKSNFYLSKTNKFDLTLNNDVKLRKDNSVKTLKHVLIKNNSTPQGIKSKGQKFFDKSSTMIKQENDQCYHRKVSNSGVAGSNELYLTIPLSKQLAQTLNDKPNNQKHLVTVMNQQSNDNSLQRTGLIDQLGESFSDNRSSGGLMQTIKVEPLNLLILDETPRDLYTSPEDGGNDPQVWSSSKLLLPRSYMNPRVLSENLVGDAPPPTYLTYHQLRPEFSGKKDDILHGLLIQEKNGLKCVDEKILEKQKGVVKSVISQAASNVWSGQSVIAISLPVRIFEPRSLLERITDWYGFAPIFLKQAGRTEDHLERMKLTISYAISGLYCAVKQQKPFNPLLGETYEASFTDGTRVYCEHTSHHPPIANFLIEDVNKTYQIDGFYEFKAKISGNTLVMKNDGPNNISFSDGQKITYHFPTIKLGGMLFGDRVLNIDGQMTFEDRRNGLKAVIIFQHKRYDKFVGKIYDYDPEQNLQKKEPSKLSEIKDIKREICQINGSILESLLIDNKEYWNIDQMEPMKAFPVPNPLPSDARYREDLIWLKKENENYAQTWKTRLEIQQRHERKLRQDAQKALSKKQSKQ
ncbi:UNKNOWN [Stylonychia lemnae]|uniref:Oxysterol-binding protein n=1 Tax=Stylonychia lemnae TaxID=5949 RepID=A0A078B8P5_STYLE|nr:UNKNOWN [Stylonychia lemnae]|eukprot:CDW89898.1 UNKNOWN [Stylonychia lemnae]